MGSERYENLFDYSLSKSRESQMLAQRFILAAQAARSQQTEDPKLRRDRVSNRKGCELNEPRRPGVVGKVPIVRRYYRV